MGDSSKHNPNRGAIAPFLSKCYEMVDDKATDAIVSWNPKDDSSFVIWDMIAFQTQVLPKYWKHGNFSSFMRQLNTYGFRKSDPDRWEFINDGFVKSQKHLLKNISRRKPAQNLVQQKHSQENDISVQTLVPQKQPQQENISMGTCVEVGKFRPLEEIEKLKQDKNVLMQELVTLSQQQEKADNKLHRLRQHLKGMELNQQQMLSLLAMAMQSPGFLIQLLQQNEFNWCIPERSNKGLLPAPEHGTNGGGHVASERRIVKYQPRRNETPNHSVIPISNLDEFQQLDSTETPNHSLVPISNLDKFQQLDSFETPNHSLVPISNLDEFQQLDSYETPNHPVSTLDEFVQQLDSSSNGLEDLFMDIDMMPFAEGISASMDEDMLHENDHPFASLELLEDGMLEKLHPECPLLENGERIDPSSPEALEDGVEPKSTNHNTLLDSSPSLDLLTEQLRLPASETKDMDP